jgi:hypothetical protein
MLKTLLVLAVSCGPVFCAPEGNPALPAPVTVLIEFDKPHSVRSIAAMERETAHILQSSGIRVEWLMMKDLAPHAEFSDLVVVHFKGSCGMDEIPMPLDERGVLGLSYASDGEVLPFGEVQCDRVKQSLRSVVPASRFRASEELLGRALGRVVAHEMYHMLANDQRHTNDGLTRPGLSPRDLVSPELLYPEPAAEAVSRHRNPN